MKFYKSNFYHKIINNKLNVVYSDFYNVIFYKNGLPHNSKDGAYIDDNRYKAFYLNGKYYGYDIDFTKESWRRFVKMQAFL